MKYLAILQLILAIVQVWIWWQYRRTVRTAQRQVQSRAELCTCRNTRGKHERGCPLIM